MNVDRIPLVRLRGFLLVPVHVELTDRLVMQLKDDVTRAVEARRVEGVIFDLTGIDFMDSFISRAIRDVSLMTRLMGVPTVLCGMHPSIAITIVEMGVELQGIPMVLDLDKALEQLESARTHARADDEVIVEEEADGADIVLG